MRFRGRVFRSGKSWAIEIPMLDITTQGRTKNEAYEMIADAVESLVNRKGFKVRVFRSRGGEFEVSGSDQGAMSALLLRRARQRAGLSLEEVAARLGSKSPNSYARYEQGRSVPSIEKLAQLYSAVAKSGGFVIMESCAGYELPAKNRSGRGQ